MADNKGIFKNTLYLYTRMLLIMVVTLYTSRVILKVLGPEDYGIQNVVGGVVTMFAFISGTISSATSRFFAYEIGRNNKVKLNQYFCLTVFAFIFIGVIVLLLAETIGLWFVLNKLTIPDARLNAAIWAYQAAILSFLIGIVATPYTSMVIAYEKMSIYAYLSIVEVIAKLGIVYLLSIGNFDKLKLYSILLLIVTLIIQSFYVIYCNIKFREDCRLHWFWDKKMFKEIFSYSGWVIVGMFSGVCRGQGLNILLNIFFSPMINAARAIAYQVNSAVNHLVNNFYTACRPQITKLYARKEIDDMMKLVFRTSRLSYYLTIIIAIPLIIETPFILAIWLGEYPHETVTFTRLVLLTAIVDSLSYPFMASISATGNIKYYHIFTGGIIILTLPLAYIFLKLGFPAHTALVISFLMAVLSQLSRIYFMRKQLSMSVIKYLKSVMLPIILVTILSSAIIYLIRTFIPLNPILNIILSIIIAGLICFYIGINSTERKAILKMVSTFVKRNNQPT